jgi:hypothetical protein
MQFEDQSAAIRQMKELLRDQSKFRAKLDRVVRKIETSSERTAKLAERNKARRKTGTAPHRPVSGDGAGNGEGKPQVAAGHEADGDGTTQHAQQPELTAA